jgi:hypothetical protein
MKKHLPNLPGVATAVTMFIALGIPLSQSAPGQQAESGPEITVGRFKITGLPEDWTHHHSMFSNPGTEEDAIKNGTHDKWLRIVNDPRYVIQQLKRRDATQGPTAASVEAAEALGRAALPLVDSAPAGVDTDKKKIKKDWSYGLGTTSDFYMLPTMYPAKWSFSTTGAATCSDFVVYPTGQFGTTTQASIIAYKNLYVSGCGSAPTYYWAYNTSGGTSYAGAAVGSPVFNLNGNQIAYVQYTCSTSACSTVTSYLVLLRFNPSGGGSLTAPVAPALAASASAYYNSGAGCAAPCYYTFSLATSSTWSQPYYDYNSDSLYIGNDAGKLYKFNPVFNGAPAEITSTFPVTIESTSYAVAPPVYYATSSSAGTIFVGNTHGWFYSYSSTGTDNGVEELTDSCYGVVDGPLLDNTAGDVYWFGNDYDSSGTYYNIIGELPTSFTGTNPTMTAFLGTGYGDRESGTCERAYYLSGAFDNAYLQSTNATGHLWTLAETWHPLYLYGVVITSGAATITGAITGPTLGENTSSIKGEFASPVTEFCNNGASACASSNSATTSGTDYIFMSGNYPTVGCTESETTGCIWSFNVSTPSTFTISSAPGGSLSVVVDAITSYGYFATGGLIIDNAGASGSPSGASQIYFLTVDPNSSVTCNTSGTGICAVQASQAAP